MGVLDKFKGAFVETVDDDEIEVEEEEAKAISKYEKPRGKNPNVQANIVMFEPRTFEDATEIARHLKDHRAAVVNLKKLSIEYKQRVSDFLQGVTYGVGGVTKHIDTESILCTPSNVGVDGDISADESE